MNMNSLYEFSGGQRKRIKDAEKQLEEDILYAPTVWMRFVNGIQIQDLKPKYFVEAIDMIEKHFIHEDVIFRNIDVIRDITSIRIFREKLRCSMEELFSLVAIDQLHEDALAGVLVLKLVKKCDFGRTFSKTSLSTSKMYSSIIDFINSIYASVDIFYMYRCDSFLRYYLLCIKPEYRKNNLGYRLMQAGIDVARQLKVGVVMGIFDCFKLQKLAKQLGMYTISHIVYENWSDDTSELKFSHHSSGKETCALMVGKIPGPPPPEITFSEKAYTKKNKDSKEKKKNKKK